jgi:cell division protein FtsZ
MGSFIAPRPRAAGAPSADALARLQAAVAKAPSGARPLPSTMQRAVAAPPQQAAAKPAERPRFGIGNLINRMAGGDAATPAPRQQPPVQSAPMGYDDEQDMSGDHERIEIPAFLRRQAN